jgi:hypothetical protein
MDVKIAALTGSALVGMPRHLDEDKVSRYAQILDQLPPVMVFESDDGSQLIGWTGASDWIATHHLIAAWLDVS